MHLQDVIAGIEHLPPDATVFAERLGGKFAPTSRAVVVELTDDELARPVAEVASAKAPGTEYFLEVSLISEFLQDWRETHGEGRPLAAALKAVILYAENDA